MASSSRVGPSVLVVDDDAERGRALADAMNEAGFTALALELGDLDEDRLEAVLESAASFLSENWHPRLGIVAFGANVPAATDCARGARAEALVAYLTEASPTLELADLPAMVHAAGLRPETLPAGGADDEIELYLYDEVPWPQAEALERTLDFLQYHLS